MEIMNTDIKIGAPIFICEKVTEREMMGRFSSGELTLLINDPRRQSNLVTAVSLCPL